MTADEFLKANVDFAEFCKQPISLQHGILKAIREAWRYDKWIRLTYENPPKEYEQVICWVHNYGSVVGWIDTLGIWNYKDHKINGVEPVFYREQITAPKY